MKIPRYTIEYTPPGGSSANVTGIQSLKTSYGIETRKDTFQINMSDDSNEYGFELNGLIKIYLYYQGDSQTIVMDGIITEITNTGDEKLNKLTIKGNNRLEILLNHQVRSDWLLTDGKDVAYIIDWLLQQASQNQSSDRIITWDSGNPSTKVDGSAFPDIEYISTFRPVFQMIEQLSSDQYTGDGNYIYYLDQTNNTLVWKPRPITTSGTIDYGTNTISIKRNNNANDVINFMIINCGKDLNDATIHTYVINPSSIGNLGWRTKYEIRQQYANDIRDRHKEIVDNDDFRDAVKDVAQKSGKKILNEYSEGTDKFDITVVGSVGYTAGGLYDVKFPHAGYNESNRKRVRLVEYEHNFDKNGWWTTLYLEEELN